MVVFNSNVTTITSRLSTFRPVRSNPKIPLFEAMDLLRDVPRLLCESHQLIAHARKEALHLADLFIAACFGNMGLSVQLGNTLTLMSGHVRLLYVTVLSRHALDATRISYYAVDPFNVHVTEISGKASLLGWMDVPTFCSSYFQSAQKADVSNIASSLVQSGGFLDSDVKVEERHGQAQREAGSLEDVGSGAGFMLDPSFAAGLATWPRGSQHYSPLLPTSVSTNSSIFDPLRVPDSRC